MEFSVIIQCMYTMCNDESNQNFCILKHLLFLGTGNPWTPVLILHKICNKL